MRSVKEECLSMLILFGEASLRRAVSEFTIHYYEERTNRARATCSLFRPRPRLQPDQAFDAVNVWAVSFDSIVGPHESFDHSGILGT